MALRVGSARALKTLFAAACIESPPQSRGMLPVDLPIELQGDLPTHLPVQVRDLNKVSARVVQHRDGRSRSLGWLLRKFHAELLQPVVLLLHVSYEEVTRDNPGSKNLLLIGLRGRVVALVGLENQLHAFRFFRSNYREPPVFPAPREIHFLLEAQNVGIEFQGLFLVVNEYA